MDGGAARTGARSGRRRTTGPVGEEAQQVAATVADEAQGAAATVAGQGRQAAATVAQQGRQLKSRTTDEGREVAQAASDEGRELVSEAKGQSRQVARVAADSAREVASTAKGEATEVTAELRDQTRALVGEARSQLESQAQAQGERLAGTLRRLAWQATALAEGRPEEAGPFADYVRQAGERIETWADELESRDPEELLYDLRDLARRRPGAFLAGAAIAGFGVGRLLRGSSDDDTDGEAWEDDAPSLPSRGAIGAGGR